MTGRREPERYVRVPLFTPEVESLLSNPMTRKGRLQRYALQQLFRHKAEEDGLPTSVRFVYYELEEPGVVTREPRDGKVRTDRQDLTDAITWLREKEIVPWAWLADETRHHYEVLGTQTVHGGLMDEIDSILLDPWAGAPPIIITEDRATAGVLARTLLRKYRIGVAATSGQVGGFLHTDLGPALSGGHRPVLYVGDLDLRGRMIEDNTRRVLERIVGAELHWRRIALTEEQRDAHELQPFWKKDKLLGDHWAVEAEALGQSRVARIVRAELDELLPEPLARVRVREAEQREAVRALLAGWRGA